MEFSISYFTCFITRQGYISRYENPVVFHEVRFAKLQNNAIFLTKLFCFGEYSYFFQINTLFMLICKGFIIVTFKWINNFWILCLKFYYCKYNSPKQKLSEILNNKIFQSAKGSNGTTGLKISFPGEKVFPTFCFLSWNKEPRRFDPAWETQRGRVDFCIPLFYSVLRQGPQIASNIPSLKTNTHTPGSNFTHRKQTMCTKAWENKEPSWFLPGKMLLGCVCSPNALVPPPFPQISHFRHKLAGTCCFSVLGSLPVASHFSWEVLFCF